MGELYAHTIDDHNVGEVSIGVSERNGIYPRCRYRVRVKYDRSGVVRSIKLTVYGPDGNWVWVDLPKGLITTPLCELTTADVALICIKYHRTSLL